MLQDECKAVASLAANQGVTVVWEQYEAMPHCFVLLLEYLDAGQRGFRNWVAFCTQVAAGIDNDEEARFKTKGTWFAAKTCKETAVDVRSLSVYSREEVAEKMSSAIRARRQGREGEAKILPKL